MKFSVIVPVYNTRDYIVKCLESLKNQTYKGGFEVIIVDEFTGFMVDMHFL